MSENNETNNNSVGYDNPGNAAEANTTVALPKGTLTEDKDDPIIPQIKEVLDKLAVFIQRDGGDMKFEGWDPKTGTCYISLTGACRGCMYIDSTLTDGVEAILTEEVPGVEHVQEVSGAANDVSFF